jgi:hypothetical protein
LIRTGSPTSGTTHVSPATPAINVIGDSASILNDHGALITTRRAKAPRARGASSNPASASTPEF